MDIKVDEDEIPTSYTAFKHYEDNDIIVSYGSSGIYGDKKTVVSIRFKLLDLRLVGGQSLKLFLKDRSDKELYSSALYYLFQRHNAGLLLNQIHNSVYIRGFQQGKEDKAREIRKALYL